MNTYVTGEIIKELREKKGYTQNDLAKIISVSEKTISKWENKRGLPDISLLEPLALALGVSLIELFKGKIITNNNKSAKIEKLKFYVCPICGNVNISVGENIHYCCGTELISEDSEIDENIEIRYIENDIYVHVDSPMKKTDYISFFAYITVFKIQFVKLYPEQSPEARFNMEGKGTIYYFNNKNGLFMKKM